MSECWCKIRILRKNSVKFRTNEIFCCIVELGWYGPTLCVFLTICWRSSLCCRVVYICTEFVQRIIQDVSLVFFTAVPLSGRLLVRSFVVGRSPTRGRRLVASYIRNCFQGVWLRSSHLRFAMAPYDKIVITIVERDTWETSLVHCLSIVTRASHS